MIIIISILCASLAPAATAQTETSDTVKVREQATKVESALRPWRPVEELPDAMCYFATPASYLGRSYPANDYSFSGRFVTSPYVFQWQGGGLYVSADTDAMPGFMAVESGRLTFGQRLGRLTISAYAEALKYGYFRGMSNSYGYGGSVTYHASDRLSVTIFGSYYTPLRAQSPAMAGYINIPTVGAYVDYGFSDRWGVKAGVQSYRSMVTGRWETQPMVIPYFKISGQHSIGVDVGGMLYQIIRSTVKSDTYSNPTLPPPLRRMPEAF